MTTPRFDQSRRAVTSEPGAIKPEAQTRSQRPGRLPAEWPLVALIIALGLVGFVTTGSFLSLSNFRAVLISASITGTVAVGMTFLTLSGNLVSLGLQQTTVLAGLVYLAMVGNGSSAVLSALAALAAAVAVGIGQAVMVIAGINAVVTTLSSGAVIAGVMASSSGGQVVTAGKHSTGWIGNGMAFGVPSAVYVFVFVAIVAELLARYSVIGRQASLMGSNRASARITGISKARVVVFAFVVLSIAAALAGMLASARVGQATANDQVSLTFDVIAAVLVGGTAIAGGLGSPLRSALGAVVIALLTNLMVLNNISTGWRLAITGLVVVIAVATLHVLGRRKVML